MPSLSHQIAVKVVARRKEKDPDRIDPDRIKRWYERQNLTEKWVPKSFQPLPNQPFPILQYGSGDRTLVYLHGGGYVHPADPFHFWYARKLSRRLGVRILFPLYPLAPQNTYLDSHPYLTDFLTKLTQNYLLVGDSAGGGYALSLAQSVRDIGGRLPDKVGLISPWVDLTASAPELLAAAAIDPWLSPEWLGIYANWWAGSTENRANPAVSPALANLSGLPPTLTFCGTADMLYPENQILATAAAQTGWDYTLVTGRNLIHNYALLPITEGRKATQQLLNFLR